LPLPLHIVPFQVPATFREHVDSGSLTVRSKPTTDAEELLPLCYRCSTPNGLLSGTACVKCKHPLITAAYSQEVLPLVEFVPATDIDEEEAQKLIENDFSLGTNTSSGKSGKGNTQIMAMEDGNAQGNEAFLSMLQDYHPSDDDYQPLEVDRNMLKAMPSSSVFKQTVTSTGTPRYFYNILPEMGIIMCEHCQRVRGWKRGCDDILIHCTFLTFSLSVLPNRYLGATISQARFLSFLSF